MTRLRTQAALHEAIDPLASMRRQMDADREELVAMLYAKFRAALDVAYPEPTHPALREFLTTQEDGR
jgi:hypothetical protein